MEGFYDHMVWWLINGCGDYYPALGLSTQLAPVAKSHTAVAPVPLRGVPVIVTPVVPPPPFKVPSSAIDSHAAPVGLAGLSPGFGLTSVSQM